MDLAEPSLKQIGHRQQQCVLGEGHHLQSMGQLRGHLLQLRWQSGCSLHGTVAGQSCAVPRLKPLPLARFGDGTAGTDPAAWHLYTVTPVGQSHVVKAAELSLKHLTYCNPGCVTVTLVANV